MSIQPIRRTAAGPHRVRVVPAVLLALLAGALPARAADLVPFSPSVPPARVALRAPLAPAADEATPEGRAALAEASAAKRAAQKLEGEARSSALASVVERYAGIAGGEAFAAAERAEAAFRGGDVLRGLERAEEAEDMYARAIELGEPGGEGREFAARALLERAHMRRRTSDAEGALALYAEVGARFADQRRQAAHARTWSGKLLLKAGRTSEAARHLQGFGEAFPEYAAEAVRNADLLAVALAESGDETGAREAIERVRRELEPVLAQGGRAAEDAQAALEALKVTELLGGY